MNDDISPEVLSLCKKANQGDPEAQFQLGQKYCKGEGVEKNYLEALKWFRLSADLANADAICCWGCCLANGYGVDIDTVSAAKYYRMSAEKGNKRGQRALGRCYKNGLGVEKNYAEAAKWFYKAAEQGDAIAQLSLGYCYSEGEGVEQNIEEAVKWYRRAAEQGNDKAQYNLGLCYKNGEGLEQNMEEAVKWYRRAAEQGNPDAQHNLGYCYTYGVGVEKDKKIAFSWFIKAAEQGYANSQFGVGYCYENGEGVEQNKEEAIIWYRKAAEQGNNEACCNLGWCYEHGNGVKQDFVEALKWYRKAAERGDATAQKNIGVCYEYGKGIEQDIKEAVKWYRKAAGQGDAIAQYRLGNMYYQGKGVEQDYTKAVKCLSMAAVQGVVYAQNNLGVCYDYGRGVEVNYEIAENWYAKAAEHGCNKAQYNLGLLYRYHHGVEKLCMGEEEFKWFRMAAESGLPEAQCRFGELFENGLAEIGLERDYIEAVKWYRKAAEQGCAIAQEKLSHMYEFGHGVDKNWAEALKWICKAAMQGYMSAMFKINFTFKEFLKDNIYKEIKERYDNSPIQSVDIPIKLICGDCMEVDSFEKDECNKNDKFVEQTYVLVDKKKQPKHTAKMSASLQKIINSDYRDLMIDSTDNNTAIRNGNNKGNEITNKSSKKEDAFALQEQKESYVNYDFAGIKSKDGYYAIVRTPHKGCIVWPYRRKTIARRGFIEQSFEEELRRLLNPKVKVLGDVNLLPQNGVRPFEPDIALVYTENGLNVRIDVEIDEPYAAVTNKPTHYIGCGDEYRDANLNCLGWIVIRFSERQIKVHSKQCIRFIADILKTIDDTIPMPDELGMIAPIVPERRWTLLEAQKMAKDRVRQTYLNHEFGKTEEALYDEMDLRLTTFEESIKNKVQHVIPSVVAQSAIPISEEDYIDDNNNWGYNIENANNFDRHISFDHIHHLYTVDGISYKAVSNVISELFPIFDSEYWAKRKGEDRGVDPKQILEEWDAKGQESREVGTFMHQQIENYFLDQPIKFVYPFRYNGQFVHESKDIDIHPEIGFFHHFLKDVPIVPFRTEWRVFDRSLRIAGTIDLICKNGDCYDIYDWKRSAKLHENKVYGYGLWELSHLEDLPINHYKLQQNLYRYILEHQYGLKVRSMNLVVFHPDNHPDYEIIAVERMDNEIQKIIRML